MPPPSCSCSPPVAQPALAGGSARGRAERDTGRSTHGDAFLTLKRLQLEWISSAEGAKFQTVMKAIEKVRQTVTPEEIEETKRIFEKNLLEVPILV